MVALFCSDEIHCLLKGRNEMYIETGATNLKMEYFVRYVTLINGSIEILFKNH